VNNAGVFSIAPVEWTPLEHMKHIADVNLWGMIDVTKTFLPLIKKSQGRVVNMSSTSGEVLYTASWWTFTEKIRGYRGTPFIRLAIRNLTVVTGWPSGRVSL